MIISFDDSLLFKTEKMIFLLLLDIMGINMTNILTFKIQLLIDSEWNVGHIHVVLFIGQAPS